jgi:hypothetical protein
MDKENKNDYFNINLTTADPNTSKEVGLNTIDRSLLSSSNVFHIKSKGYIKSTTNLTNFKIKHDKKIKSIFHNNKQYSALYKPRDDSHAFYIPFEKGHFTNKKNKYNDIIDPLINRINEIIAIETVSPTLKKINRLSNAFKFLIFLISLKLGLFSLFIIYFFLLWLVHGINNAYELIFVMLCYISLFGIIAVLYKFITSNNKKIKMLTFKHILKHKTQIESEIENWNDKVLYGSNMKAILADTFDYIQVFHNRSYVYIIDDNFKF